MRRGKPTRRWVRGRATAVTALLAVLGAWFAMSASASPSQVRLRPTSTPVAHAAVIGALAADTPLHVTVVLKPPDQAALDRFATEVSDPASPLYRDYLTPAQFGARFGSSPARLRAVESSLRSHGLAPGQAPANRLSIPVTASAGQIEHAFRLTFARVALSGGRQAVVASAPPAVDRSIAPYVEGVLGLSSVAAPHPLLERPSILSPHAAPRDAPHVQTGGPQPCSAASSAASQQSAYTADQIASAYRVPTLYSAGDQGQGVTVALYELEPNDPNDIAAYQACYGTSASVSYIPIDGGVGSGPGQGEAALDIENAIGLAPKASYLVYQGPNGQSTPGSGPYDIFSAIINQDRAQVVSVSWGECEQLQGSSGIKAESTLFEQAAAQGQTIVSASGDEGSEDCNGVDNIPNPSLAVDDPGAQPFVTSVGGTTTSSLGPPPSETAWNSGGNVTGLIGVQSGAGGGGISQVWGMPGYQSGAAGSLHVINSFSSSSTCGASSGDCREVPDVAANADPGTGYIIYYNGSGSNPSLQSGWVAVGGTSAAAPVWAALIALTDAAPACHGSSVGFANPALYKAASDNYGGTFDDVTSGNNDLTGTNNGDYPAGPGYDLATGLGTPNMAGLAPALCANALRLRSPGAQTSTVGQPVSLQLRTTGSLTGTPEYVASGLPPGLSVGRSTGRITGAAKKAGHYMPAVVLIDGSLAISGTAFAWTVEGRPQVSHTSLTGLRDGRPKLALTLRAGSGAPGLRSLSISLPGGLRFARPLRVDVTGASGKGVGSRSLIAGGRLVISLTGSPAQVTVTTGYPTVRGDSGLVSRARGGHAVKLTITVLATDASGHGATLRPAVRAR